MPSIMNRHIHVMVSDELRDAAFAMAEEREMKLSDFVREAIMVHAGKPDMLRDTLQGPGRPWPKASDED